MTPVSNFEQLEQVCVRTVADVRSMYDDGYAESESRDGLHHTTMLGIRHNQEEPMEVNAMRRKIKTMEESIQAMKGGNSKMKCYNCGKFDHIARNCPAPPKKQGYKGGQSGKDGNPKHQSGEGRIKGNCYNCGKYGHRAAKCRSQPRGKKPEHKGGKLREVEDKDSEREDGKDSSGYKHFLGENEEESN